MKRYSLNTLILLGVISVAGIMVIQGVWVRKTMELQVKNIAIQEKEDSLNIKEFSENCINAQERINLSSQFKFFKTHHAYWKSGKHTFTNNTNSLGVIYVVRDPRSIITSVLNYFHKDNYESALKFMLSDKVLGGGDDASGLPTIVCLIHHKYSSSVSPFQAKTGIPALAIAAAA